MPLMNGCGSLDQVLYACNDANMNVTALVSASGTVEERYVYEVYGKASIYDGDWQPVAWEGSKHNDVLYSGYRWDLETGLYQVRYRYYQPTLGVWASRDQEYFDGPNLYLYGNGNTLVGSDPLGQKWEVKRDGGEQAMVEGCADTVSNLAQKIGLEANEFKSWLTDFDRKGLPASENDNIGTKWREFKIPNTVLAYWAGELGDFGKAWVGWNTDRDVLRLRGFKVDERSGETAATFESHISSGTAKRELHGLFFWGHGFYTETNTLNAKGQVVAKTKVWTGVVTDSSQKDAAHQSEFAAWKPAYKLGLGILFACGTQAARNRFSANAIFWGSCGILSPHGGHTFGPPMEELVPWGAQGSRDLPPPKLFTL